MFVCACVAPTPRYFSRAVTLTGQHRTITHKLYPHNPHGRVIPLITHITKSTLSSLTYASLAHSSLNLRPSHRLLLNIVGPYRLYGEAVVRACLEAGTDYLDICGEPGR